MQNFSISEFDTFDGGVIGYVGQTPTFKKFIIVDDDTDASPVVDIYHEVDVNKEGVYYITYISGEGDLLVSVTRKVIVKSNLAYIIGSVSLFVVGGLIISLRLFSSDNFFWISGASKFKVL